MGNYFKTIPKEHFDESLIIFLKSKKLKNINETIELINDLYPTNSRLNFEEYLDAFGGVLENWTEQVFILLENNHSIAGQVDIYESLAVLIVFSGEEFSTKLEFIFKMFDFDQSEEIEAKELILTLQTSIRALCKLVKLQTPELRDLEFFAQKMFVQIDKDRSQSISYHEFSQWLLYSWELQDFMLQYAMIQTFENADRRTRERLTLYKKIFETAAGGEDKAFCESESIKTLFKKELSQQSDKVLDVLMKVLLNSSLDHANGKDLPEGSILKEAYVDVMQAWAAFDATDINHDNQTSIVELKYLLYAYEGDKPDLFRIQSEMEMLDKDGSGYVSREEWMQYLCVSDKGKSVFRGNLKNLFNKYDKDNSGFLTVTEIKQLLTDSMKDLYNKFRNKGQLEDFEGMVDTVSNQIIESLNSEEDKKQGDDTISWIEFKGFMEKAYGQQEQLRNFLKSVV